jgi:hypothetical protein
LQYTPQSFKKIQFRHSVWFDRQSRQNFTDYKTWTKNASTYSPTKITLNVTQYQLLARFSWPGNCTTFYAPAANNKTNTVIKQYDRIISSPKHWAVCEYKQTSSYQEKKKSHYLLHDSLSIDNIKFIWCMEFMSGAMLLLGTTSTNVDWHHMDSIWIKRDIIWNCDANTSSICALWACSPSSAHSNTSSICTLWARSPSSALANTSSICALWARSPSSALSSSSTIRVLCRARSPSSALSIAEDNTSSEKMVCTWLCHRGCECIWYERMDPRKGQTFGPTCRTLPMYSDLLPSASEYASSCLQRIIPYVMLDDSTTSVGISSAILSYMLY